MRRCCKRNRRAAELRGAACSPAGALAAQLPAPSSEQLLLLLLLSLFFLLPCLVAPPCNFELLVRAVLVPWGRGEQKSNKRRRPALRKTGHEEGVFHEENELQKQEENGLVLVWAALCCGPQITKGNWSQAAGTCRWSQARTWAPLVVLGRSGRSLWPPERPWPLWRRPFACRPLLSGGLSYWDSPIRPLAELRPPVDRGHPRPSGCAPLSRLSASRRRAAHRNSICDRELDLHSGSDGLDGKSAKASSLSPFGKK